MVQDFVFWKFLFFFTYQFSFLAGSDVHGHSPFAEELQGNDFKKSEHKIFTKDDLSRFDGMDNLLPIYAAVNGVVFDVSSAKDLYGPGRRYNVLAGRDASRALAKWSTNPEDLNNNLDGLTEQELKNLYNTFHNVFMKKYPVVGYMKGSEPTADDTNAFKLEL